MNSELNKERLCCLVLMDFSESSYIALKYAISLAKLTNGAIHVCHIGSPGEVVKTDNQAAALRAIESQNNKVADKLGAIVETIITEDIPAMYHHAFGNIIHEFENLIEQIKPELIVVGKKKENPKFTGKLTRYLLDIYSGSLLIVNEENEFQKDTKIAIGCSGNTLHQYAPLLISQLDQHTKTPLTLVNIKTPSKPDEIIDLPKIWQSSYTKNLNISIEQKESSSIVNGLIEHITDENIQLFCIGNGKRKNYFQQLFSRNDATLSQIIKSVQIPVLKLGNN
jgi:nucleotide-binding universal stress UspA family protein